jgi:hypothetical protein
MKFTAHDNDRMIHAKLEAETLKDVEHMWALLKEKKDVSDRNISLLNAEFEDVNCKLAMYKNISRSILDTIFLDIDRIYMELDVPSLSEKKKQDLETLSIYLRSLSLSIEENIKKIGKEHGLNSDECDGIF